MTLVGRNPGIDLENLGQVIYLVEVLSESIQ
jgi:hypothetical protein